MDEVLEKIFCLPNLLPSEKECLEISRIISSFEITDIDQFQAALKELNQQLPSTVLDYINKWLALANSLSSWEQIVTTAWQKMQSDKIFGNDELLPLTILLMPNDIEQLNTIEKKLGSATRIETGNIANFLMVNFYSAVTVKLSEMNTNNEPNDVQNDPALVLIANEIRWLEQIHQLKSVCKEYINYLLERLNERLINSKYPPHSNEDSFSDEIANVLHQDTLKDNKLNFFLEKYKMIGDMYLSLIRTKSSSRHKLIEFTAKFFHHINNLKNDNSFDFSFFKGAIHLDFHVFSNANSSKYEDKLIEKLAFLCNRIKQGIEFVSTNEDPSKLTM